MSQPSSGTAARQCNWTYMGGGWDSHQLATESEEDNLVTVDPPKGNGLEKKKHGETQGQADVGLEISAWAGSILSRI